MSKPPCPHVLVPAGLLLLVGIRALMGPTFEQFMMRYVFWIRGGVSWTP